MKRVVSMLLVLVMLLALTACGSDNKTADNKKNESTASNEDPGETTLSPRQQYEQTKQQMEELNKEKETGEVTAASFSAGGITLTLDSSFTASYNPGDNLVSYNHYSDTMTVSVSRQTNYSGYTTSRELAEEIASQEQKSRTVDSANGVYYVVQTGNSQAVKAYYVDDSGYYWVVVGYTRGGADFDSCKAQLVEFCTSGKID